MRGGSGAWLTSSLLTINKFSRALCGPVTSACLATFARSGPTLRALPSHVYSYKTEIVSLH